VHGNAYEFIRNSALDSRNYFDFSNILLRTQCVRRLAGRPIKKDKTSLWQLRGFRQKLV